MTTSTKSAPSTATETSTIEAPHAVVLATQSIFTSYLKHAANNATLNIAVKALVKSTTMNNKGIESVLTIAHDSKSKLVALFEANKKSIDTILLEKWLLAGKAKKDYKSVTFDSFPLYGSFRKMFERSLESKGYKISMAAMTLQKIEKVNEVIGLAKPNASSEDESGSNNEAAAKKLPKTFTELFTAKLDSLLADTMEQWMGENDVAENDLKVEAVKIMQSYIAKHEGAEKALKAA